MKTALTIALLLFVAASVVYLAVGGRRATIDRAGDVPIAADGPSVAPLIDTESHSPSMPGSQQAPALVVYYFHGNIRCATCRTIERYAREAIEAEFDDDLRNGRIRWQAVNFDEPANEHFVKQYELYASALVLVSGDSATQPQGQKLERIWELVGDEKTFKDYVIDQMRTILSGKS